MFLWKNESVLNSGTWKKMTVSKTGVHKITYSQIKNLGFSNPEDIRIFGNGGKMVSERFQMNLTDDLKEIPVYLSKGSDGILTMETLFFLRYWSCNLEL
ncbi:MAG: hypothetical protein HC830_07020 [Bacteroidetes bacterium]|nr:hypothetical protein [Bacteroidota bacterium]